MYCLFMIIVTAPVLCGESKAQTVDIYSRPVQVERSHDYDAIHYRVDLAFDLERKSFRGKNEIMIQKEHVRINIEKTERHPSVGN